MMLPLTGDAVIGLPGQDFWTFGRTPCAQGRLGLPLKVLILERFAASENSWAQIWPLMRQSMMIEGDARNQNWSLMADVKS